MIAGDLLKYNWAERTFVSLDSETSGLNTFATKPFNIAIQLYKKNQLIESHDLYLKWDSYKISPELAKKVHYDPIKIEKEGKNPAEVFELLKKYLDNEDNYFIGNNILNYDCMIFKNSAKEAGIDINYNWLKRTYDCNAIFKGLKLGIKPNYDNFLAWQLSMNSIKQKGLKSNLGYACKEFGIEFDDTAAHSAAYDTSHSMLLFMELIKKVDIK